MSRRTLPFLFIFSAQSPPPPQIWNDLFFHCLASLSTISSSTILPPSHKNIFLSSLVLPQQSFSRLYCPLPTISYSCPPSKIFSSLITSSCAYFFFSVFDCSSRSALNVWSRCLICSQPSRVMPSRSLYAFSWHIRCRTFRLRVFSNPVQCFSRFPIHYIHCSGQHGRDIIL